MRRETQNLKRLDENALLELLKNAYTEERMRRAEGAKATERRRTQCPPGSLGAMSGHDFRTFTRRTEAEARKRGFTIWPRKRPNERQTREAFDHMIAGAHRGVAELLADAKRPPHIAEDKKQIAQRACEPALNKRESLVCPILDKKGWSIEDWANESGVDFHTANNYLKSKTNPYRSTRKKLADSLGIGVEELPR